MVNVNVLLLPPLCICEVMSIMYDEGIGPVFRLRVVNCEQWEPPIWWMFVYFRCSGFIPFECVSWTDYFMSSVGNVNDACPIHRGFLQALLTFQNACNIEYRPFKTPTPKYRQPIGQCTCLLHRILIQVKWMHIFSASIIRKWELFNIDK